MEKAIIRQKRLQDLLQNSQVAIVANPYLLALDNNPSIDFMFQDLRKSHKETVVPKEVIEKRKENNLRRISRVQLSKVLNRNL